MHYIIRPIENNIFQANVETGRTFATISVRSSSRFFEWMSFPLRASDNFTYSSSFRLIKFRVPLRTPATAPDMRYFSSRTPASLMVQCRYEANITPGHEWAKNTCDISLVQLLSFPFVLIYVNKYVQAYAHAMTESRWMKKLHEP